MQRYRSTRLVVASLALVIPATLSAQAFGLNEIGTCAVSRGFAATASPCRDASTIFWNPAAATWLTGWNATAGIAAIAIDGNFDQDTTFRRFKANVPTSWVPHVFVNYHDSTSRFAYGLGVYVPYGLQTQWHDDFPGRFVVLKAKLSTVYIQPNIAWQFNPKWSVGGGPILGYSNVELIQALDLSAQPIAPGSTTTFGALGIARGTEFARGRLKGNATAWGAQIGIWGRPSEKWSLGLRALSRLHFNYDNLDATFNQVPTNLIVGGPLPGIPAGTPIDALLAPQFTTGGALVSQGASTRINHPAQIQAGAAYTGFKNWLLEADYSWVGWNTFKTLPLDFSGPASAASRSLIEDYNNSSAIRLGAEYTIPPDQSKRLDQWKFRAGFVGAQSAAPDVTVTPLLPEQDRNYWTLGIGVPFKKKWAIDAGYAHVSTPGARGRIVERVSESQTAAQLNTGVFHLSANVFSLTLKANF
jgi:long-chain fatty acid transport protein